MGSRGRFGRHRKRRAREGTERKEEAELKDVEEGVIWEEGRKVSELGKQ